ncbi:hypothetical protein BGZ81_007983 [Podila clonocystis]|nr:hypothetical protein BGZ81_007983 [Podila clonocystis]
MRISFLVGTFVTLAPASSPFVNTQSGSNMDSVCPAITPFGTRAAQATVPWTNPFINLHLTVVVVEEENEIKTEEDEAFVGGVPEPVSPEDVSTPSASTQSLELCPYVHCFCSGLRVTRIPETESFVHRCEDLMFVY